MDESIHNDCKDTFVIDWKFVIRYIYPLMAIVLLMSFFKVRKNLCRNFLWGRPGILYPINFIDEYQRRWMYAAVFILLVHRILFLFDGMFYWAPVLPKRFEFLKVFVVMINVVMLATEFYPLMACIVMRTNIIANILGFLLVLPWIVVIIFKYDECPPLRTDEEHDSEYFTAVAEVMYESVLIIAIITLLIGYMYDLVQNIRIFIASRKRKKLPPGTKVTPLVATQEELCIRYINGLMRRKPQPKYEDLKFIDRVKYRLSYARMQGFKYPPRIVCTVVAGLYALYKTAITFTFWGWYYADLGRKLFYTFEDHFEQENQTSDFKLGLIYIQMVQWSLVSCFIISFIIQVILMIHFVSQYRKHIRKFFAGKHTWHHKHKSSPAAILVCGMRYSGYQVAFLVYGYILVALLVFLVVTLFLGFIVIPLATKTENDLSRFFIDKFIAIWPALVVGLLLHYMQNLMAKYVFLQENGAYMALNNRRLYHVISYFLFFLNVVLGLFSCLKRILFSAFIGTLLISRLDRCLLMRGFENFDAGFKSYLGMLTVDMYHNHPIVKGFVHILKEEAKETRALRLKEGSDEVLSHKITNKKRVRNMYWKCVTLLNNPSLALERIQRDLKEKQKDKGKMAAALENIGGATAVFLGTGAIAGAEDSSDNAKDDIALKYI